MRQIFIQPKENETSLVTFSVAKRLFTELKSDSDLTVFSYIPPASCNIETVYREVKMILSEKTGVSESQIEQVVTVAEKDMARLYLESKGSSVRVSTDVTSRQSSGASSGKVEEPPRSYPRISSFSSSEIVDEESIPSEHTSRVSPQTSNSGQIISWTNLPPCNRVPEMEYQEGVSDESDSRNELIFIEYSHLSPRSAQNPAVPMTLIAEDAEEEEAKTHFDPYLTTFLSGSDYEEVLKATTPKFRSSGISLEHEESQSRPITFASDDFASLKLDTVNHSPHVQSSYTVDSPVLDSDTTLERISEEPQINIVPECLNVSNMVINIERSDRGGRRTCSTPCSML